MRQVTLSELKSIAENSREDVWDAASTYGREPTLTLHWSAGYYDTVFPEYHINITGDGEIYVTTDDLSEVLSHTWKANTGNVGIALACCKDGQSYDLGDYPPTEEQIEVMAQVVAVVCEGLWLTIDRDHVQTHGEIADNPNFYSYNDLHGPNNGCERWDLQYLGTAESPSYTRDHDDPSTGGNVIRGKANWYKNQGV